ncbi:MULTISPECIES: hypothetical protein [Paenibacillus]|uniref:hypothetical protein n=1 Tax=Paenibacillus TaxID=44249 RepID=UPI00020D7F6C|nr:MULTISPECIES: hypothetical protein [Paenibacillus]EGL16624.1 hypothetical protein HMPREF9413_5857 [Paenibacillus sp. HGF7]EPD82365.1 hypothetical protein HMPREF1207_04192 [Paenibacillus sp. HGH0039]MBV6714301.1 hypothetical protein [Paenibacillus chitinolyticus]
MGISNDVLLFIIAGFAFALLVLYSRNRIPEQLRRPMAIFALILVVCSFSLVVVSLFKLGMAG